MQDQVLALRQLGIAASAPSDEAELARIPGLGTSKLARYGAAILAVLGELPAAPAAFGRRTAGGRS